MHELISYFLLSFTSIFAIVNPFGAIPIYLSVTESRTQLFAKKLALKSSVTAFLIIVVFAFTGDFIFKLFSISVDSLRVVGGILFFIMGYDMLQAKSARTKSITEDEQVNIEDLAITPMAIPVLCGPGAITVTTVLMRESKSFAHTSSLMMAITLTMLLTYIILMGSKRITKIIGHSGIKVFLRLMGIIMMMVAVEFFFKGIKHYYKFILS